MRAEFSEFTYGFAVTREFVETNLLVPISVPKFPTLREEAREGYDVRLDRLGYPLFLQFKLSHYLKTRNAAEWRLFGSPYYRMHITPRWQSNQHRLLVELAQQGKSVYYVTPEFHLQCTLEQHFVNNSILENSAFYTPKDIGILNDNQKHYVVFLPDDDFGYVCSNDPKLIGKHTIKYALAEFYKPQKAGIEYYKNLVEILVSIVERTFRSEVRALAFDNMAQRHPALIASYISHVYFGCMMFAQLFEWDK